MHVKYCEKRSIDLWHAAVTTYGGTDPEFCQASVWHFAIDPVAVWAIMGTDIELIRVATWRELERRAKEQPTWRAGNTGAVR